MTAPYYSDDLVTLYLGDCREVSEWLAADVLVTDPPYGRKWSAGHGMTNSHGRGRGSRGHGGIAGDKDTSTRDRALAMWDAARRNARRGVVFGDPLIAQPAGAVQAMVYQKPPDAGVKGARAGRRRDVEMVYLVGPWPAGVGGESSVITTRALVAGPRGVATRAGHPHAKPLDVMAELVRLTAAGTVSDPFAGSGTTLLAARHLGRRAIGVEVEERYCEISARRLSQGVLEPPVEVLT